MTNISSLDHRRRPYRNGKADFLLAGAEIRRDLEANNSMRWVYDLHRDKLGIGYIQFTRYVKRFIKTPAAAPGRAATTAGPAPVPPRQPAAPATASAQDPRRAAMEAPKRFHFDPMAVDQKNLV